jgi:hypothetical protein
VTAPYPPPGENKAILSGGTYNLEGVERAGIVPADQIDVALGHVWTALWQGLFDVLQHWSGAGLQVLLDAAARLGNAADSLR